MIHCVTKFLHIEWDGIQKKIKINSSYASDLGISSTCVIIDYSTHLLEFVLFVYDYDSIMIMTVCVHCNFLIWFSPMIFILHLKILPRNFIKWGGGN